MRKNLMAAVALATTFLASPAFAGVLVADAGWFDDQVDDAVTPSENSAWTFTVSQSSILSVVDCCNTGDVYTLVGDVAGITTFYAGAATDVQATGSYGGYWTDGDYSKIALNVGPGTYSFSIFGDGAGGFPAGLGVRLDTAAVPEPASWAMMLGGFGLVGGVMRARRGKASVSFA